MGSQRQQECEVPEQLLYYSLALCVISKIEQPKPPDDISSPARKLGVDHLRQTPNAETPCLPSFTMLRSKTITELKPTSLSLGETLRGKRIIGSPSTSASARLTRMLGI
jgi:hypothetical protein